MSSEQQTENTLDEFEICQKGPDLKEGTHVGRYQILGLIGKGGMGAVYKAYDPELDRSIAIKILTVKPQEGETASQPQARLMREAQALAKLSHPNVVSVFDVGTYEEGVYIAMEYVKGKTLRTWLKDEKPALKEIILTLSNAGLGLHAAHVEGIVHRDFKPDNVIIGDKGQVKVLDFGLARAAGTPETVVPQEETAPEHESTSGEKLLSKPLTRVGAMVGTTVYMAPEHFRSKKLDEKTDQFSFSVTLFEALYGKRPFPGKTVKELEENITSGWVKIPQEANVPKWIEEIIRKGISVSKDDRYHSMAELLDDLAHDPEIAKRSRRKKLVMTSVILFLISSILGLVYYAFFKSSKVCTGASAKVAEIWNDERKKIISQAFMRTKLSYAQDSFVRVAKRFEEYLLKWKTEYTANCEATRIMGEQSEEIMDLKMACLTRLLRNASALSDVLSEADSTVIEHSIQALSNLSKLSTCSNIEALRSKIPLPKSKQIKVKVASIRKKLAVVEAYTETGKYREGLKLAKILLDDATRTGYKPVHAETLYHLGVLLYRTGEYKDAEMTLSDAALVAGEGRVGLVAAKSLAWLVGVVGYKLARPNEGLSIARDAEVLLGVAGGHQRTKSRLLNNTGTAYYLKSNFAKMLEHFNKSLAILEKLVGPEEPSVATALDNIGYTLSLLGRYDESLKHHQRGLAIRKKILGDNHPQVAESLHNMGVLYFETGDYQRSLECHTRVLSIVETTLGHDHPHAAHSQCYFGEIYYIQRKYEKALEHFSKAVAIFDKAMGAKHPDLASPLCGIGKVFVSQGMHKQALKPLRQLLDLCNKVNCNAESHGLGLFKMAQVLLETGGDKGKASKFAKQAHEIFAKTPKQFKKELEEVNVWMSKNSKGLSLAKQ